jgi:hypothetical protein
MTIARDQQPRTLNQTTAAGYVYETSNQVCSVLHQLITQLLFNGLTYIFIVFHANRTIRYLDFRKAAAGRREELILFALERREKTK